MFREQEPELIITLPPQQQQQQGEQQQQQQASTPPIGGSTAAGGEGTKSGAGAAPEAGSTPAAAAATATAAVEQQAPAAAGGEAGQQPSSMQLSIVIIFSKPAGAFSTDTALLVKRQCMVANPLLRRSRALFPCIDSPLYLYTPGAMHYLPYTFDLFVTVPPSCMAVCSGVLVQQTCSTAPHPNSSSSRAVGAGGSLAAAAGAAGGPAAEDDSIVVARTFEYSVGVPVVPAQLSIAVGPFVAIPYADLLAAGGSPGVSLPDGTPVITVFALRPQKHHSGGAAAAAAGGKAADGAAGSGAGAAGVAALGARELRQLADTLRPLAVVLGCYAKLLACSLPWSHLQVAVLPEGTLLQPWQVGVFVSLGVWWCVCVCVGGGRGVNCVEGTLLQPCQVGVSVSVWVIRWDWCEDKS